MCAGIGKIEDDRLAQTSPQTYLRLELALLFDDYHDVVKELGQKKCQLSLPQTPLVPYAEPSASEGNLLPDPMLDLLDLEIDAAIEVVMRCRAAKSH